MGKAVRAELQKLLDEVYEPEHIFDEETFLNNRKKICLCTIISKDEK